MAIVGHIVATTCSAQEAGKHRGTPIEVAASLSQRRGGGCVGNDPHSFSRSDGRLLLHCDGVRRHRLFDWWNYRSRDCTGRASRLSSRYPGRSSFLRRNNRSASRRSCDPSRREAASNWLQQRFPPNGWDCPGYCGTLLNWQYAQRENRW